LLEAAARGLSRYGYGNLVLEQVAREAGYTRGALYHQFKDKEDLALAVLHWADETWQREVGELAGVSLPVEGEARSMWFTPEDGGLPARVPLVTDVRIECFFNNPDKKSA